VKKSMLKFATNEPAW